jgi:hypothetical protein
MAYPGLCCGSESKLGHPAENTFKKYLVSVRSKFTMSMFLNSSLLVSPISSTILRSVQSAPLSLQRPMARLEYELPKPPWLENLAVMKNGSILTAEMTTPRL